MHANVYGIQLCDKANKRYVVYLSNWVVLVSLRHGREFPLA